MEEALGEVELTEVGQGSKLADDFSASTAAKGAPDEDIDVLTDGPDGTIEQ